MSLTRASDDTHRHWQASQRPGDHSLYPRATSGVQTRLGEHDGVVLRRQLVTRTQRWAERERRRAARSDIEIVLWFCVNVGEAIPRVVRGVAGQYRAREEDEGEEDGEDEPYSVGDTEGLLVEAGGGLF